MDVSHLLFPRDDVPNFRRATTASRSANGPSGFGRSTVCSSSCGKRPTWQALP